MTTKAKPIIELPLANYCVLGCLKEELMRARSKFPGNKEFLPALVEEVGELAKALLERSNKEHIFKEAIQVACVAMRKIRKGARNLNSIRITIVMKYFKNVWVYEFREVK